MRLEIPPSPDLISEFRKWASGIHPRQLELAVRDVYASLDWEAEVTPEQNDGGFDVRLQKKGLLCLVEVKQRNTGTVGRAVVQKLAGAALGEQADKIVVVTNGSFTSKARREARRISCASGSPIDVELVSGDRLCQLMLDNGLFHIKDEYSTYSEWIEQMQVALSTKR